MPRSILTSESVLRCCHRRMLRCPAARCIRGPQSRSHSRRNSSHVAAPRTDPEPAVEARWGEGRTAARRREIPEACLPPGSVREQKESAAARNQIGFRGRWPAVRLLVLWSSPLPASARFRWLTSSGPKPGRLGGGGCSLDYGPVRRTLRRSSPNRWGPLAPAGPRILGAFRKASRQRRGGHCRWECTPAAGRRSLDQSGVLVPAGELCPHSRRDLILPPTRRKV